MSNRSQNDSLTAVQSIDPVTLTGDANGTGVDLAGFESALVIVAVGESGDTLSGSVKVDLELEHSDDNSTWSDCAAADTVGEVSAGNFGTIDAAAEDDACFQVAYVGGKRYIRPVINLTGTHTNGIPVGAVVVKGMPRSAS